MKIWLIFIVLLCLMASPTRGSSRAADETITSACFNKFFYDLSQFSQTYRYKQFESDKDESLKTHSLEYKEKLFEYSMINGIRVRRLLESNQPVWENDKKFKALDNDFNLDQTFFDRFEYRFKQRSLKSGISVLIFQFYPRPNLPEPTRFDRVINQLVGEICIRESDSALLSFQASLPDGLDVTYGKPPAVGGIAYSAVVLMETEDKEGLTIPSNVRITVHYSTSFLLHTSHFEHTKIIQLKTWDKISVTSIAPQEISHSISKDHELSDDIWTTKRLMLFLTTLGLFVTIIYFLGRKIKKRFSSNPR